MKLLPFKTLVNYSGNMGKSVCHFHWLKYIPWDLQLAGFIPKPHYKDFEIIITAFNKGDKATLKNLVSKDVYKAFESAINDGSNNPNSQFYSLVVDGINDAKVENGKIIIGVNFISEQILSYNEEDIVKNKDTWVFEKQENSNGPA